MYTKFAALHREEWFVCGGDNTTYERCYISLNAQNLSKQHFKTHFIPHKNTMKFHYKIKLIMAVYGNNHCLF
jgi:hypothetical protein